MKSLRFLIFTLPLLAALILYAYAARLPFFLDDGLLFTMIRDYPAPFVDGLRFWGGSPSFPYYRPLAFSLWEAQYALLNGRLDPFSLHMLNIFLFGLSGTGLALIVRRLTRRDVAALLAGMIFVLFPFNYSAVIWVASLFHVMMVCGLIFSLYFGLVWNQNRRRGALFLCWILAAGALFSHEMGVLILPLLWLALMLEREGGWRRFIPLQRDLPLILPLAGLTGLYLVLFVALPRPGGTAFFQGEGLFESLAVFLQGLIYPFSATIRALTQTDAAAASLLALAAIVVGGALFWLWRRSPFSARLAAFGLIWYLAAGMPSILLLPAEYVKGGPRLLLLSAAGAGIFWAALLSAEKLLDKRRLFALFRTALIGIGLFVSLSYLNQRKNEALMQSDYLWALRPLLQEAGPAPMVINAPAFLAARIENRAFWLPVSEGVIFMEGYVSYDQQLWPLDGHDYPRPEAMAFFPGLNPPPGIGYAPYQTIVTIEFTERLRESSDVIVTAFDGAAFYPVAVGKPGESGPDEPFAQFPDAGVNLTDGAVEWVGQTLVVTTRWRVDSPQKVQPVIEIRCDGQLIAQSIMQPWGGAHPFWAWQPGEIQTDRREIRLKVPLNPACLEAFAGIVPEEGDLARFAAFDAQTNTPYPDQFVPLKAIR